MGLVADNIIHKDDHYISENAFFCNRMTRDRTVCAQLDEGTVVPRIRYLVYYNHGRFSQNNLSPSITKCIIDINKVVRTKNIFDGDEGAVFHVWTVNGSSRMLFYVGQQVH